MGIELKVNSEHTANLVERLPLEELKPLFLYAPDYDSLQKRAEKLGISEGCIHYIIIKNGSGAGNFSIREISLRPKDNLTFSQVSAYAIDFMNQRREEIRGLLNYSGELHAIISSRE